jgi:hypothetical protein
MVLAGKVATKGIMRNCEAIADFMRAATGMANGGELTQPTQGYSATAIKDWNTAVS